MKDVLEFAKKHPIVAFLIVDTVCVCIKQVVSDVTNGTKSSEVVTVLEES